jgi:hypothetical protein
MMKYVLALVGVSVLASGLSAQSGSGHWIRRAFNSLAATGATSSLFTQISQEGRIPDKHVVIADVTGGPATCTFQLEGSATGSAPWIDLSGDQDCSADMAVGVINRPFPYVRVNLSALSGGSSPSVVFTYIGAAQ